MGVKLKNRQMMGLQKTLEQLLQSAQSPRFLEWATAVLDQIQQPLNELTAYPEGVRELEAEEAKILERYAARDSNNQKRTDQNGNIQVDPTYEEQFDSELKTLREETMADAAQRRQEAQQKIQSSLDEYADVEVPQIHIDRLPPMQFEQFLWILPVATGGDFAASSGYKAPARSADA